MTKNNQEKLAALQTNEADYRATFIEAVAEQLVLLTAKFAGDEPDFRAAMYVSGPDGDHALAAYEGGLAERLERNSLLVDIMKSSLEWNETGRDNDVARAALAIVNEAVPLAERNWSDRALPIPGL